MSFLFKIILVMIFIYLIYQIFLKRKITNDPYSNSSETEETPDVKDDVSLQKKIDMSKVEDADFKDVK